MRRHGFKLPEPTATGHLNTEGFNLSEPKFKAQAIKCIAALKHLKSG